MDSASINGRRFGGIARLYGQHGLDALNQASVCVVGVGGVGSWTVEALARSGVGNLTLIDLDNIAESNTNRQLHALSDDFGKAKVRALAERIEQINPLCRVTEIEDFVDESNLNDIFSQPFDFVVDAIDQLRIKAAMAAYFVRNKQKFIVSGGAGGQRNPALIRMDDLSRTTQDPLLAKLRYSLRKNYGFARGNEKMRVPCVYSVEQITPPMLQEACDVSADAPQGLSCAGYGAAMPVTATFGLFCAQAAIEHIVQNANKAAR